MSNISARVLTSFVFGIIALYFTWVGGVSFFFFTWGVGGLVLYEWISITKEKWNLLQKILAGIFYLFFGLFLILAVSALLLFCMLVISAFLLYAVSFKNVGWISFGFLYSSLPVVALSFLRGYEDLGFWVVIFLFAIVWGTDIAAYFNGRALGGRKLAPKFSPNKTWSGALGGSIVGVFNGVLIAFLAFDISPTNIFILLLSLTLSIVSQISDLGQSYFKRRFSVKDSGFLLPGHGGFMDRMDGLIGASCFLYLIGSLLSSTNAPFSFFCMI
ncbi:phosphatidate cytidylyltransferase [Bartonella sp. F02]|uniref:phosphatidate cytidylyltransferase n=1 Tax=Bartonella sp. F02 TaxID=2967262 RepID=UPI0022A8E78F|nr:phosphatidate cytidylyltransferase [Bartonella sp. F02]MCZ2328364.1 phosphatidate cytidylyltransferase [Bartonella sp. F02]